MRAGGVTSRKEPRKLPDQIGMTKVKQIEVPYATGSSSVVMSAPVTIPRAPWEDD